MNKSEIYKCLSEGVDLQAWNIISEIWYDTNEAGVLNLILNDRCNHVRIKEPTLYEITINVPQPVLNYKEGKYVWYYSPGAGIMEYQMDDSAFTKDILNSGLFFKNNYECALAWKSIIRGLKGIQ